MEMSYGNISVTGASYPGLPLIIVGKTPHLAWGCTSARTDLADLFREEIKGDSYLLDGEWKPLQLIKETIKVKGKAAGVDLVIRHTHRGPVLDSKLLQSAEGLNPEGLTSMNLDGSYSLAWSGSIPYESSIEFLSLLDRIKDVKELNDTI